MRWTSRLSPSTGSKVTAFVIVLALVLVVFSQVRIASAQSGNTASFLPPSLAPYSSIINMALLFVDGLLFGFAIKKGILSAILLIVAFALTSYIGFSIPYLSASDILTHVFNIGLSLYRHVGLTFLTFPIFFLLGLVIGLWKG